MNILIVVGARPNFMKAAPIIAAIEQHNQRNSVTVARQHSAAETIRYTLVHTGQHYDDLMSSAFFRDLGLPKPDVHLGVGSASHAVQTAEVMKQFELVLLAQKPDLVVVVGDVNSTIACALVAAKITYDSAGARPLIAHVEAGLRSFDRSMPEEINRVLTDHVSDLLFVTERSGLQNLQNEGISSGRIHFVGNTMIDSLLAFKEKAECSSILEQLNLRENKNRHNDGSKGIRPYALLTLHRPANVDNAHSFLNVLCGLKELASTHPIIFPAHPRTRHRLQEFGPRLQDAIGETSGAFDKASSPGASAGIVLTEPLGYLDFLCLMKHARLVVTDSGGVQEETTCLGIPCVTVRGNTERPITVEEGTNIIAGTEKEKIKDAVRQQAARKTVVASVPEKWDGQAATRIVSTLLRVTSQRSRSSHSLVA